MDDGEAKRLRERGEVMARVFEQNPELSPLLEGLRTQRVYRRYHPRPWALFWIGFVVGVAIGIVFNVLTSR